MSDAAGAPDEGTAAKPAILVSACLVGVRCNHLGAANTSAAVVSLGSSARLVPVCPEVLGGLPTPRPAAVLGSDGRVVDAAGDDVTAFYAAGASGAVALGLVVGARRAVLKARSPSCGCGPRMGVTAAALAAAGIEVGDEEAEARRDGAGVGGSAGAGGSTPPPTMEPPSGA